MLDSRAEGSGRDMGREEEDPVSVGTPLQRAGVPHALFLLIMHQEPSPSARGCL